DLVKRAIAQTHGDSSVPSTYKPSARDLYEQAQKDKRIPEATLEGNFNEAPVIGRQEFQAPIVPTTPSTQDAAPVQGGPSVPETQSDAPQPFKVKETPLDEMRDLAGNPTDDVPAVPTEEELSEFELWKRARQQQNDI